MVYSVCPVYPVCSVRRKKRLTRSVCLVIARNEVTKQSHEWISNNVDCHVSRGSARNDYLSYVFTQILRHSNTQTLFRPYPLDPGPCTLNPRQGLTDSDALGISPNISGA